MGLARLAPLGPKAEEIENRPAFRDAFLRRRSWLPRDPR
jgi:hypothetical protein